MPISYREDWYDCPHYSGRGGSGIVQVTFHTTEGAKTNASLANWLGDPNSQVSYHASVDDERGVVARYVDSDMKAWAQAGGNPFCLSVCFCAFVAWSQSEWLSHENMLQNAAAIARTFCDWYKIPMSALNASQAQSAQKGISQHVDGGSGWSNHSDCGPNFPEWKVIEYMGGSSAPPTQPPPGGGEGEAPPLHVDYFGTDHNRTCPDVLTWQSKMHERGWYEMIVDGDYGPISKDICIAFQQEKGLGVDGYVGPETWNATWNMPT
jgi:N-acetylmuramoyl-L-alanine amidase/Putative peptidoglycan binding domain